MGHPPSRRLRDSACIHVDKTAPVSSLTQLVGRFDLSDATSGVSSVREGAVPQVDRQGREQDSGPVGSRSGRAAGASGFIGSVRNQSGED